MREADLHPDAFIDLLTDALRAGPASPAWHEAVERLRDQGSNADADEHRLLLEARERLESGRSYRSVRAGPGFTRRLMSAIDDDERSASERAARWARFVPPAGVIAVVSSLLVVAALVGLAYYLKSAPPTPPAQPASPDVERLAGLYLIDTVQATDFENAASADESAPPTGWHALGRLPIVFSKGLRAATPTTGPAGATQPVNEGNRGGIVSDRTLPAADPFAVEVMLLVGKPNDNLTAQVVIGAGDREFVALIRDGRAAIVLPDGSVATQTPRLRDLGQPMTVRVTIDRQNAIVEAAGKRLWAGPHGLSASAARMVSLRFLKRGAEQPDPVAFQSVKILTAPAR